jgi:hypothetical protein
MSFRAYIVVASLTVLFSLNVSAREYGGRWEDESIREYSMKFIKNAKERFGQRAAQLSKVNDFPLMIEYLKFSDEQKEIHEKFLKDRISDRDRTAILSAILKDLESVRTKLVEAEKIAFTAWEKLPKEAKAKKNAEVSGEIYGTKMSSSRLGVLLDNSPSMRPYLDAVRGEIKKSFPSAQFREAADSGLHLPRRRPLDKNDQIFGDAWFYGEMPASGVNPFDPKWHQNKIYERFEPHIQQVYLERNGLPALIALIRLQEVDTIYWFSDFEDDIDPRALQILKDAIADTKVKFYVHSSKRRPKKELIKIIEASGGEVIRKRIR